MKIAIILPVYNVEKRLQICLDSIFKQTYKNFIIVAINDGSTDGSLEILKNNKNDSRLIIINQENKGLSGARNSGLQFIDKDKSIDLVTFIDSDDRIESDYLEHCVNSFTNYDIDCYYSGYVEETENSQQEFKPKLIGNQYPTAIYRAFINGTISTTIWSKIFKKSICNNLFFPPYNPGEDFCGNIQILLETKKPILIDDYCGYYYYRDNSQPSITRSKRNFRKRMNCINTIKFVYELTKEREFKDLLKNKIINTFFCEMPYFICTKLEKKEKDEIKAFKKWAKLNKIFSFSKNKNLILYKYFRPIYFTFIKVKYSKYYK